MCGDNKSYRGIFCFAERAGMLLLECLLAASLLALMVSAWPAAVSWHEEYVLYLAAKELQMAIREAQVQAHRCRRRMMMSITVDPPKG